MKILDISLQARVAIGISAMVILFAGFLVAFIANQRKKLKYHRDLRALHEEQQRALTRQNMLLEDRVRQRTMELSGQKEELQNALSDLKASQTLLIQKEKMASLGEVASGIAHEIQNPLNFVNNFAEINTELLLEMKELLAAEKAAISDNGEMKLILDDVISNLKKIHQHGRRADAIVKSMLEHSRSSSGTLEPTDINEMLQNDFRLAYHGQRAKDGTFDIRFEQDLDPAVGKLAVVPQDLSRVFLNIIGNAFYSVSEKKTKNGIPGYKPILSVRTRRMDGKVEVRIRDNGMGIPQKVRDKVFQPFFTTKPTGEGTGLGLSMSYEIIMAHRGDMTLDSMEGEYAEIVISLPAS